MGKTTRKQRILLIVLRKSLSAEVSSAPSLPWMDQPEVVGQLCSAVVITILTRVDPHPMFYYNALVRLLATELSLHS